MKCMILIAVLLGATTATPYDLYSGAKDTVLSFFGNTYVPLISRSSTSTPAPLILETELPSENTENPGFLAENINGNTEYTVSLDSDLPLLTERADKYKLASAAFSEESSQRFDDNKVTITSIPSILENSENNLEVLEYPVYYNISKYIRHCGRTYVGTESLVKDTPQEPKLNLEEVESLDTVKMIEERLPEISVQTMTAEVETLPPTTQRESEMTTIETEFTTISLSHFEEPYQTTTIETEAIIPELFSRNAIPTTIEVETTAPTVQATTAASENVNKLIPEVAQENIRLQETNTEQVEVQKLATNKESEDSEESEESEENETCDPIQIITKTPLVDERVKTITKVCASLEASADIKTTASPLFRSPVAEKFSSASLTTSQAFKQAVTLLPPLSTSAATKSFQILKLTPPPFSFIREKFENFIQTATPKTGKPVNRLISFTTVGRNNKTTTMRHFLDYLRSLRN